MEGEWIVGNGRDSAPISSEPLLIGKDNSSSPRYYEGGIDEVELFDAAFDLEVIRYIYTDY
jgi:hypothetical protein